MKHTVTTTYDIGLAQWNALSKQEYISLAELIINKSKRTFGIKAGCLIKVQGKSYSLSEYSVEEFRCHFPTNFDYQHLAIELHGETFDVRCSFSCFQFQQTIRIDGNNITLPLLENLAAELKAHIEKLYAAHVPQVDNPPGVSLSKQVDKCNEPDKTHCAKSQSRARINFCKEPVFWAALTVIVTVILWFFDRFVLHV